MPSINSFCGLQQSCQRLANALTFFSLRLSPIFNTLPESVATQSWSKSPWGPEELCKLPPGIYKDRWYQGQTHLDTHCGPALCAKSDASVTGAFAHLGSPGGQTPFSELGCKTTPRTRGILFNPLRIISVQNERERRFWHQASLVSLAEERVIVQS